MASLTGSDVAPFTMGADPCVLLNSAASVREVMLRHGAKLQKPEFVKASNRGHWGDGLTTLEGDAWRNRRRAMVPSFKSSRIAKSLPVVAELARETVDRWTSGSPVDMRKELEVFSARISAKLIFDADVAGFGSLGPREKLIAQDEAVGEKFVGTLSGSQDPNRAMVRPRAPRQINSLLRIIDAHFDGRPAQDDILSDVIKIGQNSTEIPAREDVVGEVVQMLYAGHLTIPTTLINLWRDIFPSNAAGPIYREAARLSWEETASLEILSKSHCLAALRESMRLHPPAPILYREVLTEFSAGGHDFERGEQVYICPYLLHQDGRYFDEPDQFKPERFLGHGLRGQSRWAYMPFGIGPRTCIAAQQTLMHMALFALVAAQRFALVPQNSSADHLVPQPTIAS